MLESGVGLRGREGLERRWVGVLAKSPRWHLGGFEIACVAVHSSISGGKGALRSGNERTQVWSGTKHSSGLAPLLKEGAARVSLLFSPTSCSFGPCSKVVKPWAVGPYLARYQFT